MTEANDVVLEYRHDEKSAVFKQGQDAQMVPFDLQIKDGDVIGMAFVHEKNMMAITFNGDLYGRVDKGIYCLSPQTDLVFS